MADNAQRHHRPRTSRKVRHRLIDAVESAGADSPSFHEALQVAVAYLEIATDTATCPKCGSGLERQGERYECYNCPMSPRWEIVLGIDEPDLKQPPSPKKQTNERHNQPPGNWNQRQF